MLNQTRRALEEFDNQHDFERMAADILNALGYASVEPMAPSGGGDGGKDIRFREGETPGVAFVTLEKKIGDKFRRDLQQVSEGQGVIALFCNVDVSPSMKLKLAKEAIAKGYRLEVFDLERLRSLLDAHLKDVRRRYLHIDDELAARLRSEVVKLLRFPAAIAEVASPPTTIEKLLLDRLPCRLFDLLLRYEEGDLREVPHMGKALGDHLTGYYCFRERALKLEEELMAGIGQKVSVRFPQGWQIYLRYVLMRFGGNTKEKIISGGDFLNYGITWDDAERVYLEFAGDGAMAVQIEELLRIHQEFSKKLATQLTPA